MDYKQTAEFDFLDIASVARKKTGWLLLAPIAVAALATFSYSLAPRPYLGKLSLDVQLKDDLLSATHSKTGELAQVPDGTFTLIDKESSSVATAVTHSAAQTRKLLEAVCVAAVTSRSETLSKTIASIGAREKLLEAKFPEHWKAVAEPYYGFFAISDPAMPNSVGFDDKLPVTLSATTAKDYLFLKLFSVLLQEQLRLRTARAGIPQSYEKYCGENVSVEMRAYPLPNFFLASLLLAWTLAGISMIGYAFYLKTSSLTRASRS